MTQRRYFKALLGSAIAGSMLAAIPASEAASGDRRQAGATNQQQLLAQAKGKLETKSIKLGYIPILESAPLIIAKEKGFCAQQGLTDMEVAKQASWPAARDNVVIGSGGGGIDGGQWQLPMPQMLSEGAISNGKKVPMFILAQLSSQGNGIAASNTVKGAELGLNLKGDRNFFKDYEKKNGREFRAAYTFPKANQEFWIRYWLAAGGVDPDKEVSLLTVPAAETVAGMRNGTMDLFSTGDPWPARVVNDNLGYMAATTAAMWPVHPEEFLAVRADWVKKNPKATVALVKCVIQAQRWLDNPANKDDAAEILSSRNYFNVKKSLIEQSLKGGFKIGVKKERETNPAKAPLFWSSSRGVISYPYKSLTKWFLVESLRWKFYPNAIRNLKDVERINNAAVRADIWTQAAKELGVPAKDIPKGDSRGKERFFDGVVYDPANPQAYLKSLKIKR